MLVASNKGGLFFSVCQSFLSVPVQYFFKSPNISFVYFVNLSFANICLDVK